MTDPDIRALAKKRRWFPALLFVSLILSAASGVRAANDVPVVRSETRVPVVSVAVATPGEVVAQVPVSGTLLPRTEILIYPEIGGLVIESFLADVGDRVKKGDVLAQAGARTLAAQLAQAEAEVARATAGVRQAENQIASATASQEQADAALARAQQLSRSGNVSGASLDNAVAAAATAAAATASATDGLAVAQAAVQQAQAQAEIARLNLSHATITAPADGLISHRNGQRGAITSQGGEPLFRLIEDGALEIEAEVIETALGQISPGDPATIAVAGVGTVEGKVRRISPTVDPASRLGTIRIETAPRDGLRSGVFASGVVTTDRHTALLVPATAVLVEGGESHVLRVEDGVLRRVPVVAGLIWEGQREIVTGLSEGDTVVARAGAFFGDGDRVEPSKTPTATTTAAGAGQ